MKANNTYAALLSLALIGAGSAFAQTATTDPVGFVTVTVPANSDAVLAVPLNRTAEHRAMIQTISGNTITVAGANPSWSINPQKWVFPGFPTTENKTYAVQIASGAKEGMIAKIVSNTANSVTIQLAPGDSLAGVIAEDADAIVNNGDQIDIMPYWTPSSIFTGAVSQDTAIFLYPTTVAGSNLSAQEIIQYDSGNWYDSGFGVADHSPLPFGQAFVLRNAGGSSLAVSMVGSVPMASHRSLISVLAGNTDQDILLGYSSPIPEAIGNVTLGFTNDDQLLIYNNAATGINKSASKILYYSTADGWLDGDTFEVVNTTFFLQPGQGYIFRKKAGGSPSTIVWQDLQSYLN